MPTYDYRCKECRHELALFQSIKDEPMKECPECGRPTLIRLIGAGAGIIFRGSGFYETDYKRSRSPSESKKEDSGKKDSKKSEKPSKPSDSKKSD